MDGFTHFFFFFNFLPPNYFLFFSKGEKATLPCNGMFMNSEADSWEIKGQQIKEVVACFFAPI